MSNSKKFLLAFFHFTFTAFRNHITREVISKDCEGFKMVLKC